ncbi:MAG: sulfate/thiosulfate transport system substrate-binding protein [Gaiellaceae bacterium]|nr:sulfate/thiosulfate transport system substrate-binding protein [Gaiellaceae bacterium]
MRHPLKIAAGLVTAVVGLAALAGCGGPAAGDAAGGSGSLSLVAYSTPKEAYAELIPAFNKTPAGKGVKFTQSYGASGDQSRAVAAGLPADIVALSLAPDIDKLVDPGIVDANWAKNSAHNGFVTNSVVVLAVRKGNPKHIKGWDDLIRPGVEVVTPNPFSSGSAKWNILAAYGAQRRLGKTDAQATDYVKKLFQHVVSQDTSGANATNTFLSGKGDVLITYESEAINARLNGRNIQYVIPRQTLLIELPIAVLKNSPNKDVANKFIQYVKGVPSQELFVQYGFRPVNKTVAKEPTAVKEFPARPGIFRIDDQILGGWRAANKKWFEPNNGLMTKIEQGIGGPTAA